MKTRKDNHKYDPKELYKDPRGRMWSPNTYVISVVLIVFIVLISLPLVIDSIVHWYRYVPPALLFLAGSVFFFLKSYRGLFKKRVKLFPEGRLSSSNEAGFIGGKASNIVSGRAAQFVGVIMGILGIIFFRICLHFAISLFRELG